MSVSQDEVYGPVRLSSPSLAPKSSLPQNPASPRFNGAPASPPQFSTHATCNDLKASSRTPESDASTPPADYALSSASSAATDSVTVVSNPASLDVTSHAAALSFDATLNVDNTGQDFASSPMHLTDPVGKLRASTPGCATHVINRLPQEVIAQIISHVELGWISLPSHVERRSLQSVVLQILGWRKIMLALRRLCKSWKMAVDEQVRWLHFLDIFTPGRSMGLFGSSISPFTVFNVNLRTVCVACCLVPSPFAHEATVQTCTPRLGLIKVCKDHALPALPLAEYLSLSAVCFCCLSTGHEGAEEYAILENLDPASFGLAVNVCAECRCEALVRQLQSKWNDPLSFDTSTAMPLSRLLRSNASASYLEHGEGTAADAAEASLEEYWLDLNTDYRQLCDKYRDWAIHHYYQRKHALKDRQLSRYTDGFASELDEADDDLYDVDDDEDEESFDWLYLDQIDAGKRKATKEAMQWWCVRRLEHGIYQSAQEQRAKVQVHDRQLYWQTSAEARPAPFSSASSTVAPQQPVIRRSSRLPPPALAARMTAILYSQAFRYFFERPMACIVESLRKDPQGLDIATSATPDLLLGFLRNRAIWGRYERDQHGRHVFMTPKDWPLVPASAADVGEMTMWRLMEMWREACKPLEVCSCNICARQKRKRSPSLSPLSSPSRTQTVYEDDTPTDHSMTPEHDDKSLASSLAIDGEVAEHKKTKRSA